MRLKALAKDRTRSNTDWICEPSSSRSAFGGRVTMFRNPSINAHKGCRSSALSHLEGSMSSTEANRSLLWPPQRKGSPQISSLLASPTSHLHPRTYRTCMQLTALPLPSSCCQLLLWRLLAQHGMARHSTAWHGIAWYSMVWHSMVSAMDAAPCRGSHPTPFPLPLPAAAASTSLPESKGELFLQPYLAGLPRNILRDMEFLLGCSLII